MRRLWSGSAKKGDTIELLNPIQYSLIAVDTSGIYMIGKLTANLQVGAFYSGLNGDGSLFLQAYVMNGSYNGTNLKINSCSWTYVNNISEHDLIISNIYELFRPAQ